MIFTRNSNLNDSVFGASYEPICKVIESKAEAWKKEAPSRLIFNMEKSKHYAERMTGMTGMDGFKPVPNGGGAPKDMMQESYSKAFVHHTWKDSFELDKESIDDAVTINLKKKPQAFIDGFYRTRELFAATLLNGAIGNTSVAFKGSTFDTTAADGLSMFNTAHTSKLGYGVQSNAFANPFSVDDLGLVATAMQNYKGDNDEKLAVKPDTIIIPNIATLKNAVFAAIGSDKDPDTANNGYNYQCGLWNVIINPYWDTTSPYWIVMSSDYNKNYGGAVWFDRMELEVKASEDPDTWNMKWTGMARFTASFFDWRAFAVGGYASGSTLS